MVEATGESTGSGFLCGEEEQQSQRKCFLLKDEGSVHPLWSEFDFFIDDLNLSDLCVTWCQLIIK